MNYDVVDRVRESEKNNNGDSHNLDAFCVDSHNVDPFCVDPPSQCCLGFIAVI